MFLLETSEQVSGSAVKGELQTPFGRPLLPRGLKTDWPSMFIIPRYRKEKNAQKELVSVFCGRTLCGHTLCGHTQFTK